MEPSACSMVPCRLIACQGRDDKTDGPPGRALQTFLNILNIFAHVEFAVSIRRARQQHNQFYLQAMRVRNGQHSGEPTLGNHCYHRDSHHAAARACCKCGRRVTDTHLTERRFAPHDTPARPAIRALAGRFDLNICLNR